VSFRRRFHHAPRGRLRPLNGQFRRGRAALELDQIKRRRFFACDDRAAGVRLAAMVGLVIEHMQQDLPELLANGAPDMLR